MTDRIIQQLAASKPTPMSLSEDELDAIAVEIGKRHTAAVDAKEWDVARAINDIAKLISTARDQSHQTRSTARRERLIARQARHLKTLRHPKP